MCRALGRSLKVTVWLTVVELASRSLGRRTDCKICFLSTAINSVGAVVASCKVWVVLSDVVMSDWTVVVSDVCRCDAVSGVHDELVRLKVFVGGRFVICWCGLGRTGRRLFRELVRFKLWWWVKRCHPV